MKTEHDRKQLIKDIYVLLNQAYDSTLDEIYTLLKNINDAEDEEDIKAIREGRKDAPINGISWEEIKNEITKETKKDVA